MACTSSGLAPSVHRRCVRVAACVTSSLRLTAAQCSAVWLHRSVFMPLSLTDPCLSFGTGTGKAALNGHGQVSVWTMLPSLGLTAGGGTAGSLSGRVSALEGTAERFSPAVAPFLIPARSAPRAVSACSLLHGLTRISVMAGVGVSVLPAVLSPHLSFLLFSPSHFLQRARSLSLLPFRNRYLNQLGLGLRVSEGKL